jgi:hypothetical protein
VPDLFLFFDQHRQMMKNMPTWRVKEVLPDGKGLATALRFSFQALRSTRGSSIA